MKTVKLALSEQVISNITDFDTQLRDTVCPNLIFRFLKSEGRVGTFHVRFTKDGITTTKVLGSYPTMNIRSARRATTHYLFECEKTKHAITKQQIFSRCGELLNRYQEIRFEAPGTAVKTKSNIAHQIKNVLNPILGVQEIAELSNRFLAEEWLIPNFRKYKLSTIKSSFHCLKAAFNQMTKLGYLAHNPLSNIFFRDLTAAKVKPKTCKIQSTDLQKLVNQIRSFDPAMKMMCFLCLGYLTRNRETAMARWEHFNFKKMLWTIPAENTKTGQGISHPLTPSMRVLLKKYRVWQRHKTRSKYLFPQLRGYKPISESQAANLLAKLSKKQFSLHDLRKYGSSYLRDMGVDYYIVERILNHKMTTLDQTYIHTSVSSIVRYKLEQWHSEFFKIN
jgi:integrase